MPNLFRSVGMVVWAWRSVFACSLRPAIWVPFLLIALTQILALIVLLNFYSPAAAWLAVPLVRSVAGEAGTHYPTFFLALPAVFGRANLVLAVVVTSLAVGAATLLFAQAFGHAQKRHAWSAAWRRYPVLFTLTLILVGALFAVSSLGSVVPQEAFQTSKMVRWGTRAGLLLLVVVIQSLLAYASAWALLKGRKILPALRDSVRLAGATLLPTLLIVAAPALLMYPLSYLAGRGDLFFNKFRPETMTALLGTRIAVELILGFFLVGAITRVFLYQTEESR